MVKPNKPLATYIRVSRVGDRGEKLRSPDFQRAAIERYATAEGLELRAFDPELDVSGSNAKRPVLDAIIAAVQSGELGGLVVSKLDRLSRLRPRNRVELFETIEDAGGVVLSASEQLDPATPEGRFTRDLFLGVARMQWEKYREGYETAKAGAIAAGIPVCSQPAVGLRQRKDRRLEADPDKGPIVREVFERRAQGEGPSALRAFLAEHGMPMSKTAVYDLIANRVYLGEISYGSPPRYVNLEAFEPLVDVATWHAAQGPKGGRLAPARSPRTPFLLSGILRCSSCRYATQGTTNRGVRIYRCTRDHRSGQCPDPVYVHAADIEPAAVEAFWRLQDDLVAEPVADDHGALHELREALEQAERRLLQLEGAEAQNALGDRYLRVFSQRVTERDHAARDLGQAQAARATRPTRLYPVALRDEWERMTTTDRRELMSIAVDVIALRRGRSFVVYPAGLGPDRPRQGVATQPALGPFPDPPRGIRVTRF
jgi:site-specific DNA recombinase